MKEDFIDKWGDILKQYIIVSFLLLIPILIYYGLMLFSDYIISPFLIKVFKKKFINLKIEERKYRIKMFYRKVKLSVIVIFVFISFFSFHYYRNNSFKYIKVPRIEKLFENLFKGNNNNVDKISSSNKVFKDSPSKKSNKLEFVYVPIEYAFPIIIIFMAGFIIVILIYGILKHGFTLSERL